MKPFKTYIKEEKENAAMVDDIVTAMDDAGVKTKVYDGGENFNVSFKGSDGVEYYIRPNDKGSEKFYVDADKDGFKSFKVADMAALKTKVKGMVAKKDD